MYLKADGLSKSGWELWPAPHFLQMSCPETLPQPYPVLSLLPCETNLQGDICVGSVLTLQCLLIRGLFITLAMLWKPMFLCYHLPTLPFLLPFSTIRDWEWHACFHIWLLLLAPPWTWPCVKMWFSHHWPWLSCQTYTLVLFVSSSVPWVLELVRS